MKKRNLLFTAIAIIGFVTATMAQVPFCTNDTLTSLANIKISSNDAVLVNNKIYSIEAWSTPKTLNEYNISNGVVQTINNPSFQVGETSLAYYNGKLYIFGGNTGSASNMAKSYDLSSNTWLSLTNMPVSITQTSSVVFNNKIYITGATLGSNIQHFLCFDPSSNNYTTLASPTINRSNSKLIIYNNSIYCLGGHNVVTHALTNDFSKYNSLSNIWTSLSPMPYSLTKVAATVWGDYLYVFGGNSPIFTPAYHYFAFDFINGNWIVSNKLLNQEISQGAVTYQDTIYLIQGVNSKKYYCSSTIQQGIQDTIIIPDTVSHISNTIEIPVRNTTTLTTSNNVISYQFNVTYNAAKMQYIGSNLTGTIASVGNVTVNSSTSGKLVISYMTTIPILGKGNLLKLKFQPLQIGTSQLAISNFLYNTDTIFNTHIGNYSAIGLYGDIDTNTHVQAYDAALDLQYSVGLDPLPITAPRPWLSWRFEVADVDGNDTITANDASLILQYSANLISTFPVGTKTMENPIANITITQENNELVFKSNGDLFGLNVNTINGSNITLSTPTSIISNMLSAFNIAGSTYNIGLCTTNSPTNNSVIMRIPFTCIASDTLTFNMFVNKNSVMQKVYVDKYLGIEKSNQQQINIYPNPATNQINVQINQSLMGSSYTITNQIGKTVLSGKLNTEKSTIEIGNLSGGIYLFSIDNNAKQTFKVIKK